LRRIRSRLRRCSAAPKCAYTSPGIPSSFSSLSHLSIWFVCRDSGLSRHQGDQHPVGPPKKTAPQRWSLPPGRSRSQRAVFPKAEAIFLTTRARRHRSARLSAPVENPQSCCTAEAAPHAFDRPKPPSANRASVLVHRLRIRLVAKADSLASHQKSSHLQGFAPPTSPYCLQVVSNPIDSLFFHGLCSPSRSYMFRLRLLKEER